MHGSGVTALCTWDKDSTTEAQSASCLRPKILILCEVHHKDLHGLPEFVSRNSALAEMGKDKVDETHDFVEKRAVAGLGLHHIGLVHQLHILSEAWSLRVDKLQEVLHQLADVQVTFTSLGHFFDMGCPTHAIDSVTTLIKKTICLCNLPRLDCSITSKKHDKSAARHSTYASRAPLLVSFRRQASSHVTHPTVQGSC